MLPSLQAEIALDAVIGNAVSEGATNSPPTTLLTSHAYSFEFILMLTNAAVLSVAQSINAKSKQFCKGIPGKVILNERPVPPLLPTDKATSPLKV